MAHDTPAQMAIDEYITPTAAAGWQGWPSGARWLKWGAVAQNGARSLEVGRGGSVVRACD